jgi:hypothetical protein
MPQAFRCGADGLLLALSLSEGGLAGVRIDVGHPAPLDIPGNGFETDDSRFADLTSSGGTYVVNDRDVDADGVDDSVRISYATTSTRTFGPGTVFSLHFDCPADTVVPRALVTCSVDQASDPVGNARTGITCTLDGPS